MRKLLGGLVALLTLTIAQPALPVHASGGSTILVKAVRWDTGMPAFGVQIYATTSVGTAQYQNTAWGGMSAVRLADDTTEAYIFGVAPNYGPSCWGYAYTPVTPGATISVTVPIVCYPVGF